MALITYTYSTQEEKTRLVNSAESSGYRVTSDTHYPDRKELVIDSEPDTNPLPLVEDPDVTVWKAATTTEQKLAILAKRAGLE